MHDVRRTVESGTHQSGVGDVALYKLSAAPFQVIGRSGGEIVDDAHVGTVLCETAYHVRGDETRTSGHNNDVGQVSGLERDPFGLGTPADSRLDSFSDNAVHVAPRDLKHRADELV